FGPPDSPRRLLVRSRLLTVLAGRFERRLTLVQAGAGFGKTTLLSQAVYENSLSPRGIDLWLTCETGDSEAATLGAGLRFAMGIGGEGDAEATAAAVANAIWQRSPNQVALLVDDVHEVPPASSGAALLAALVAAIPGNGHLVVASRRSPPIPVA